MEKLSSQNEENISGETNNQAGILNSCKAIEKPQNNCCLPALFRFRFLEIVEMFCKPAIVWVCLANFKKVE